MIKFIFYKSLFILQAQKTCGFMLINGFSKLSKKDKIDWLLSHYLSNDDSARKVLEQYWFSDEKLQALHDEFIENPISNYPLPYAIAPNFLIDGKTFAVPMVIEESSVVAAAAKSAKFWAENGGFSTRISGVLKTGHVHFTYDGDTSEIITFFRQHKKGLLEFLAPFQAGMIKRNGGIKDLDLIDKTHLIPNYFQLAFKFDTVDAMGANFINTILEEAAVYLRQNSQNGLPGNLEIIMSILSNFTPECLVRAEVSCPVEYLKTDLLSGEAYVKKFMKAIEIAKEEPYRAVTHNKGIMNGIDAVVLATGNDFRAVEANAHAFASHTGKYKSLSDAKTENGIFSFWIELPLAIGTVGGLTAIHPLVKFSLQLLQNPSAKQLMRIMASVGLAQNFAAVNALITSGIQIGHMKMHLNNLLTLLNATETEKQQAYQYFSDKKISLDVLKKLLGR
jgi:hydroxymethylglutaryl-CoA reductase